MRVIKIKTKSECILVPENRVQDVRIEPEGSQFRIVVYTTGGGAYRVETLQPNDTQAAEKAAEILGADINDPKEIFEKRSPMGWV